MKAYFLWLAKLVTLMAMLLVGFFMFMGIVVMMGRDAIPKTDKRVAVVELNGLIESSKEVVKKLHEQIVDDKVKGVVLRINSPGGAVGPSQDIYNAVRKLKERKPIVASMGSVAASGGLYAALGASKIFCQPGTLTGSVGVVLQIPNFTKVAEKLGVEMVTIKSGELKDVGNSFRTMTEKDRKFLQSTVDEVHTAFVDAVVEGRGIPKSEVEKFADGRVILGSQALALNLVDEYGDVYDAGREVFKILGEPLKDSEFPELFYVEDRLSKLRRLLDSFLDSPVGLTGRVFERSMELRFVM